jgi:hypothetical protein
MIRSFATLLMLAVVLSATSVVAQVSAPSETFTGIHRNEAVSGRPETVTITDGKSFIQLTEREYRASGYRPAYEKLPTKLVRRVPVRKPFPADQD